MANAAKRRYWSPQELAAHLNVTAQAVRGMVRDGRLPGIRVGRLWRIPAPAVNRLLQLGTRQKAP